MEILFWKNQLLRQTSRKNNFLRKKILKNSPNKRLWGWTIGLWEKKLFFCTTFSILSICGATVEREQMQSWWVERRLGSRDWVFFLPLPLGLNQIPLGSKKQQEAERWTDRKRHVNGRERQRHIEVLPWQWRQQVSMILGKVKAELNPHIYM